MILGPVTKRVGVLLPPADWDANWPIATYCPSLGPFPSKGGGAHRPLIALCPSSSSLPYPSLSTSLPFSLGTSLHRPWSEWGGGRPGPHAHGNAVRQVVDRLRTEVWGQQKQSHAPRNNQHNPNTPTTGRRGRANGTSSHIQHSPSTPTTGLRERGNDTSKSTGRGGRQKAATRRNMRRVERVTVQGPVKKQQPDGMSHRGC